MGKTCKKQSNMLRSLFAKNGGSVAEYFVTSFVYFSIAFFRKPNGSCAEVTFQLSTAWSLLFTKILQRINNSKRSKRTRVMQSSRSHQLLPAYMDMWYNSSQEPSTESPRKQIIYLSHILLALSVEIFWEIIQSLGCVSFCTWKSSNTDRKLTNQDIIQGDLLFNDQWMNDLYLRVY